MHRWESTCRICACWRIRNASVISSIGRSSNGEFDCAVGFFEGVVNSALFHREVHPLVVENRSGASLSRTVLASAVFLELSDDVTNVCLSQPFVAVGENGEADDDVGVGKLGAARGNVLGDEGNGKKSARHGGWFRVGGERLEHRLVFRLEQSETDARDLGQNVRKNRLHPLAREIQKLDVRWSEHVVNFRSKRGAWRVGAENEFLDG